MNDDIDAPPPKKYALRFDGVITAGNLISLLGMLGAVVSGGFYLALSLGHQDERLTAETTMRERSIQNLQAQILAERTEEGDRLLNISHRIDDSVDAERAVIAQINAALGQISSRLDAAILGVRERPFSPSQNGR